MNTTEEYWTVNGESLNTFAWNISTLDGRESMMPTRGENAIVGDRPGQAFVRKIPDARPVSLRMWVKGCDEDGYVGGNDKHALFLDNWQKLKRMFTTYDAPVELRRRRLMLDGTYQETVCSYDVTGTPSLTPSAYDLGMFQVDGVNLDAFWLSDEQTITLSVPELQGTGASFPFVFPLWFGVGLSYANRGQIVNDGDVAVPLKLIIYGPLTNPSVVDAISGRRFQVLGSLSGDDVLVADGRDRSVLLNGNSRRDMVAADSQWLVAAKGTTEFTLSADLVQTGTVSLAWRNAQV